MHIGSPYKWWIQIDEDELMKLNQPTYDIFSCIKISYTISKR